MDEQLEFVKIIVNRLDKAQIPYMLTGSMALAVYAAPRMTRDIDLVIDVDVKDVGRLARLFESDCYIDQDTVREAVARRRMFNIIHNEWIIKADFIIRKNEPYRQIEFERRRQVDIDDTTIAVVAPEDLILSKLCWGKESESGLQERDVKQLLRSVQDLDWSYLEKWAKTLGVAEQLEGAKSE